MITTTSLGITNSSFKMVILNSKEMLGILDLRSTGYYKLKHGALYIWTLWAI